MVMNFSSKKYYDKAMEIAQKRPVSHHTAEEAFFLLLHGASKDQLSNLIKCICNDFPKVSEDACYDLIQAMCIMDEKTVSHVVDHYGIRNRSILPSGQKIMEEAYYCLANGPLGQATSPDGRFNLSDWMGHSLLAGQVCANLATLLGHDPDKAMKYGFLHDYGRRWSHGFDHTVIGFEKLIDLGWENEAIGCLTHSYLNGGRCASNEPAQPGFYVNEAGDPCWTDDAVKDDTAVFLENYTYGRYDTYLNIADLMATARGVVSPSERLADIATRRQLDETNRGYFLAEFTSTLLYYTTKIRRQQKELIKTKAVMLPDGNCIDAATIAAARKSSEDGTFVRTVKFTSDMTIDQVKAEFEEAARAFYTMYRLADVVE